MTESSLKSSPTSKIAVALAALILSLAFAACKTAPVVIPQDMDAPTMILKAQEASDAGKLDLSIRYYQALLDRFGSDPAYLATGQYEIAFITFKQGDKAKAKELFTALLDRYQAPGGDAMPDRYKVLAQKILAEIH